MFLGNAKMEISGATVVAALQEYFDARVKAGSTFVVKAVSQPNTYSNVFEVLTEPMPTDAPDSGV